MLGLKWVLNLPHSNEDAALPELPSLLLQTLLGALCSLSWSALMYYCWLSWQTFLRSVFTDVFYVQGHVPAIMTKWLLLTLILGGGDGGNRSLMIERLGLLCLGELVRINRSAVRGMWQGNTCLNPAVLFKQKYSISITDLTAPSLSLRGFEMNCLRFLQWTCFLKLNVCETEMMLNKLNIWEYGGKCWWIVFD